MIDYGEINKTIQSIVYYPSDYITKSSYSSYK